MQVALPDRTHPDRPQRAVILCLLASFVLLCGCGLLSENRAIPTVEVDLNHRASISDLTGSPAKPLRFAVAGMMSPAATLVHYRELLDYLGRRVGVPVELIQRRTYQEVNDMLLDGQLDAAFICSGGYVQAGTELESELLAVPVVNGKTAYRAYIIVGGDSEIESFEQLRDRSFAFTDPLSNTGWLYPAYRVNELGTTPASFFSRTSYTHSHDRSITAVADGLVSAASVDSLIYDYLAEENPRLLDTTRIIERSPEFGIPPVVSSPQLNSTWKRAIHEVLTKMHSDSEGRAILDRLRVDRFEDSDPTAYEEIRSMVRSVGQWRP